MRQTTNRGGTNRVGPCLCFLLKRGCFDKNGEKDEFAFYPLKTTASLLRPPKTTKMTKIASVTQAKSWFRKSRVCSSLNKTSLRGPKCKDLRPCGPKPRQLMSPDFLLLDVGVPCLRPHPKNPSLPLPLPPFLGFAFEALPLLASCCMHM